MNSFKKNIYRTAEEVSVVPPDPTLYDINMAYFRNNNLGTGAEGIIYNNTKGTSNNFTIPVSNNNLNFTLTDFAEAGDNISIDFNNANSAFNPGEYSAQLTMGATPAVSYVGSGNWSSNNDAETNPHSGIFPTSCPFASTTPTVTGVSYIHLFYIFTMPAASVNIDVDMYVN